MRLIRFLLLATLTDDLTFRIVAFLLDAGDANLLELADALDASAPLIDRRLETLLQVGFVERNGEAFTLVAAPQTSELLAGVDAALRAIGSRTASDALARAARLLGVTDDVDAEPAAHEPRRPQPRPRGGVPVAPTSAPGSSDVPQHATYRARVEAVAAAIVEAAVAVAPQEAWELATDAFDYQLGGFLDEDDPFNDGTPGAVDRAAAMLALARRLEATHALEASSVPDFAATVAVLPHFMAPSVRSDEDLRATARWLLPEGPRLARVNPHGLGSDIQTLVDTAVALAMKIATDLCWEWIDAQAQGREDATEQLQASVFGSS